MLVCEPAACELVECILAKRVDPTVRGDTKRECGNHDQTSKLLCSACLADRFIAGSAILASPENRSTGYLSTRVPLRLRPDQRRRPDNLRTEKRRRQRPRHGGAVLFNRSSQRNSDVGCRRDSR